MRTVPRVLLAAAGCLLAAGALLVVAAREPAPAPRLVCPEYAAPGPGEAALTGTEPLGRVRFDPTFERETPEGDAVARSVDSLFQAAWDQGTLQPRALLNDLVFAAVVEVHDVRNEIEAREGEPWAERVTERQVALAAEFRDALGALSRGALSGPGLLRMVEHVPPRLLLACSVTLRDRRLSVPGSMSWERGKVPPHDVTGFVLERDGLRVPVRWAGTGPIAEVDPTLFARAGGAYSWWTISVTREGGADVLLLHDFLGMKGR